MGEFIFQLSLRSGSVLSNSASSEIFAVPSRCLRCLLLCVGHRRIHTDRRSSLSLGDLSEAFCQEARRNPGVTARRQKGDIRSRFHQQRPSRTNNRQTSTESFITGGTVEKMISEKLENSCVTPPIIPQQTFCHESNPSKGSRWKPLSVINTSTQVVQKYRNGRRTAARWGFSASPENLENNQENGNGENSILSCHRSYTINPLVHKNVLIKSSEASGLTDSME